MKNEIWKEICGLERRYKVSNTGRVWSVKTNRERKLVKDKNGYLQIHITKNREDMWPKVHRLVAEAFIPNPNLYPVVNHKNENKMDNRAENLEWCTKAYNNAYGSKGRAVVRVSLENNEKKRYATIADAARKNKIDSKTIYRWCQKDGGIGRGYRWWFEDEMIKREW